MNQDEFEDFIIEKIDDEEFEDAENLLIEYKERYSETYFYYLASSDLYMAMHIYDEVIYFMEKALEDGYDDIFIYERLGDSYFQMGEYEEAIDNFTQCGIEVDSPYILRIRFMIGMCYERMMEYGSAIPYFEDVLLEDENSSEVKLECGMCYLYEGNTERGFEYLDSLCINRDRIYDVINEFDEDIPFEWIEHFAKLFEDEDDQYYVLSNYYENKEEYEKCLPYVDKMIESDPNRFHYALKAYYYALMDDFNHVVEYYEKAMNAYRNETVFEYYELEAMIDIFNYLQLPRYVQNNYYKEFYPSLKEDERVYFDLANQAVDSHNKTLGNRLIKVHEYDNDPRMIEFKIKYYLTFNLYKEGLDYLKTIDEFEYPGYMDAWIVFNYYLENYEDVIEYKEEAMENGVSAFLTYMSFGLLNQEENAEEYLKEFQEFVQEHGDEIRNLEFFVSVLGDFLDEISE